MHARLSFALAATAALALAACDTGPNSPDDRVVDTAEVDPDAVDVNLPGVPVEYPEVPVNARGTVDYEGTYSQTAADGGTRTLTLRENDTWAFRDETGRESSGTFNWYNDNSRILIRRNGQTEVYAVAEGALYRLPDANAPTTGEKTPEQIYRRVVGPGGAMGSASSVDGSVQDVPDE